jgi:type IV pilus biogenesis protein PilP
MKPNMKSIRSCSAAVVAVLAFSSALAGDLTSSGQQGQPARPAPPAPISDSQTFKEVGDLQAATAIVKAQVDLEEQRKALAQAQKDIRELGGQSDIGDGLPQPGEIPLVLRVEGSRNSMRAVILMPSGGLLEVQPGETVGAIGRIVDISASGVRVEGQKKGVIHTLIFAAPRQDVSERSRLGAVALPGTNGRPMTAPPVPVSQSSRGEQ